jgi:hypothetical protein
MKALIQFIFPTLKAVFMVTSFFVGLGWASYGAVALMVKAEANVVESKIMAVRNADFQHLNGRFDRLESKIDVLLEEKR